MSKVYTIIHGPNLNKLGDRELDIYGRETLEAMNKTLKAYAEAKGVELKIFQHSGEGEIIDTLHREAQSSAGFVINPAAYSHTSVAIRDAISATPKPTIEVHLSNIYAREEFRQHSVTAGACIGQITGFGSYSYLLALKTLLEKETKEKN